MSNNLSEVTPTLSCRTVMWSPYFVQQVLLFEPDSLVYPADFYQRPTYDPSDTVLESLTLQWEKTGTQ